MRRHDLRRPPQPKVAKVFFEVVLVVFKRDGRSKSLRNEYVRTCKYEKGIVKVGMEHVSIPSERKREGREKERAGGGARRTLQYLIGEGSTSVQPQQRSLLWGIDPNRCASSTRILLSTLSVPCRVEPATTRCYQHCNPKNKAKISSIRGHQSSRGARQHKSQRQLAADFERTLSGASTGCHRPE